MTKIYASLSLAKKFGCSTKNNTMDKEFKLKDFWKKKRKCRNSRGSKT